MEYGKVSMRNVTAKILDEAVATAREYGATELILFGSALDPTRTPRDLDLACRGVEGWEIFGWAPLWRRDFKCRWTSCP